MEIDNNFPTSINCPLKGINASDCNWTKRRGGVRDAKGVGVVECSLCGLVTHEKDLASNVNYESGTMHDWAGQYGGILENPVEDITRRVDKIRTLSEKFKINSILDYGCGHGEMLQALGEFYEVHGLEPDDNSRIVSKSLGFSVYADYNEVAKYNRKFSLISLFHVIEHFYDPSKEIKRIHNLLEPNGLLVIETPNANDALLELFESSGFQKFTYWSHHPMLHSSNSLNEVIKSNGFTIVESTFAQRYGLANHLYWLSKGEPGGHVVWGELFAKSQFSNYDDKLIEIGLADTLWLVAQK